MWHCPRDHEIKLTRHMHRHNRWLCFTRPYTLFWPVCNIALFTFPIDSNVIWHGHKWMSSDTSCMGWIVKVQCLLTWSGLSYNDSRWMKSHPLCIHRYDACKSYNCFQNRIFSRVGRWQSYHKYLSQSMYGSHFCYIQLYVQTLCTKRQFSYTGQINWPWGWKDASP